MFAMLRREHPQFCLTFKSEMLNYEREGLQGSGVGVMG